MEQLPVLLLIGMLMLIVMFIGLDLIIYLRRIAEALERLNKNLEDK